MCIAVEQQNGFLLQLILSKGWSGNISSKAPPKHPRNLVEDNGTIQTQDEVTKLRICMEQKAGHSPSAQSWWSPAAVSHDASTALHTAMTGTKKKQANSQHPWHTLTHRLFSEGYWINKHCDGSHFSAKAAQISKLHLYLSQTAEGEWCSFD